MGAGGGYGSGKMDVGRVDSPDCNGQYRTTPGNTQPANGGHRSGEEGRSGGGGVLKSRPHSQEMLRSWEI